MFRRVMEEVYCFKKSWYAWPIIKITATYCTIFTCNYLPNKKKEKQICPTIVVIRYLEELERQKVHYCNFFINNCFTRS